ncbi:MAG TPA: hypothetical protein VFJ06_12740 [Halococcus sp.]|nr:hypothetical protein [Halococcus sp.]
MSDDTTDQKGPWLLALGALVIGGVAISVEGYRAVRRRFREDDESTSNE